MPSVMFTGGYDAAYPRTDVIIKGLQEAGVCIEHQPVAWSSPIKRMLRTYRLLKKTPIDTDFVYIPSFCHHEVLAARRVTSMPIIFDPLISRYLTKVHDYKNARSYSFHGIVNRMVDLYSMRAADFVLADTNQHKEYFASQFMIPREKIHTVYVGCNSTDFAPLEKTPDNSECVVGFYGSFIPLHGADIIVEVAHALREHRKIRFECIGQGSTLESVKNRAQNYGLSNIAFLGKKPYAELPSHINRWDICLGIFGKTLKADLVIPNKVYHYAACKKPIITKLTPAIQELFEHENTAMLCRNDPLEIAKAILRLADDAVLSQKLGNNAYSLAQQTFTHAKIGESLASLMTKWLSR